MEAIYILSVDLAKHREIVPLARETEASTQEHGPSASTPRWGDRYESLEASGPAQGVAPQQR
jgi:hypothetical protein